MAQAQQQSQQQQRKIAAPPINHETQHFWDAAGQGKLLVKMTDLGLSREINAEEFRVTRAGTTVGTVDYISPEQARDSGLADIRSDLYSLGCTWYHLLAGKAVFPTGKLDG